MKSVSKSSKARRHFYLYAFTVVAGSGAALAGACSSSSDTGTSGGAADSGTDVSKGSSGTSGADAGTIGAQDKDTCKGAAVGNSCQCSCAITGQKEDKTLHCLQPAQDTGECPTICCTGALDASGSSSGTVITDAGDGG